MSTYIAVSKDATFLYHHGILGQKWGIKNGPPYPLEEKQHKSKEEKQYNKMVFKNLKNSKTTNLEKWGKTKDTNILYITGLSGSGKSTIASYMADDGKTDTIHLDMYFSQMSQQSRDFYQNKAFNSYLDKHVKNWRKIPDMLAYSKKDSKVWKKVDEFVAASEKFGQQQFSKKRKVIMEGVELLDTTMYENPSSIYKEKPIIILQTNRIQSAIRGSIRDEVDPITTLQRMFGSQSSAWNKNIRELENSVEAKRGSKWINEYIVAHK